MTRPDGETRRERRLQRIVGVGIVLIFVLLGTNLLSGIENYQSQTSHHATTVKQNKEIISLLQTVHNAQKTNHGAVVDIKNLETEVATVIKGLPSADTTLVNEAEGIAQQLEAICMVTEARCPPLPSVSASH
jgi:hypothetical protein